MEEQEQEESLPLHQRIIKSKVFLPSVIFAFVILLFSISSRFSDRIPVIDGITPSVAYPGDVVVIAGKYFGDTRQGSEVAIAGLRLPSAMYLEWQDTRISLVVPKDAGSGPVFINTRNGRSNNIIFTNRNHIPVVLTGPAEPGFPYVENVNPTKGSVGTLITITGQNFGNEKGTGKALFTSILPTDTQSSTPGDGDSIEAFDLDFDYEVWTDREIQVRIPDGASSGGMLITNDAGKSNSHYIEVTEPVGSKILKQKRGYQVQFGVQLRNIAATGPNSIYLWIPQIYKGLEQRNMEVQTQPRSLWQTYPGLLVFQFENLKTGLEYGISETFWFERYAVESRLNQEKLQSTGYDFSYDRSRKLFQVFTSPDDIVPSGDDQVKKLSLALAGRQANPYLAAYRIFTYLLENFAIDRAGTYSGALTSLSTKRGDSYSMSLLFCALLRAAGIPTRPVAGYVVYGNRNTAKHYWTEFYIQDFGWLPADLTLAAGVRWPGYPDADNTGTQSAAQFYFGNIDNQHITVARGILPTIQISPRGVTVGKTAYHSFQGIYEESIQLTGYGSIWSDASIIEWW